MNYPSINKKKSDFSISALTATTIIATTIVSFANANAQSSTNIIAPAAATIWDANARKQCVSYGEKYRSSKFVPIVKNSKGGDNLETIIGQSQNGYLSGDFNGDGKTDYIVVTANGGCVPDGPLDYGRSGPPNNFIISSGTTYKIYQGFGHWITPDEIKKINNRHVYMVSGGYNGSCGDVSTVQWGWTGTSIDVLQRKNSKGQIVNQEGCVIKQASPTTKPATNPVAKPTSTSSGTSNIKPVTTQYSEVLAANAAKQSNPTTKATTKPTAAKPATTAVANFPPITPGYYAFGMTCAQAIAKSNREYPSDNIGLFNKQYWGFFYEDGMPWGNTKLERIKSLGNNRYTLSLRSFGNGDDKNGDAHTSTITILSNGNFFESSDGFQTTYINCPTNTVPAWLRKHFE